MQNFYNAGIPLTSTDKCHWNVTGKADLYVDMGYRKWSSHSLTLKPEAGYSGIDVNSQMACWCKRTWRNREFLIFRCRQLKRAAKMTKTWVSGNRVFAQVTEWIRDVTSNASMTFWRFPVRHGVLTLIHIQIICKFTNCLICNTQICQQFRCRIFTCKRFRFFRITKTGYSR